MSQKKQAGFGNDGLKQGLSQWKKQTTEDRQPAPSGRQSPPTPPSRSRPLSEGDDLALFRIAMEGVEPVAAPETQAVPGPESRDGDDAEALAQLSELVAGDRFVIEEASSALQGLVEGADRGLLPRLVHPRFPLTTADDLAVASKSSGLAALERALTRLRRTGARAVAFPLGTGGPVTPEAWKSLVRRAFATPAIARISLAFVLRLGGGPSLLVLLRR